MPEGKGMPVCTAEYWPSQGGGTGTGIESAGEVGEKEPMPSVMSSAASDDGAHDVSGQARNAADHGRPAVSKEPENATGSIFAGNPTAGEGSTNTY